MSRPGPGSGGPANIPLIPINHTVVSIGPSPTQPPTPPQAPPPLNLPLQDLFQGLRIWHGFNPSLCRKVTVRDEHCLGLVVLEEGSAQKFLCRFELI
ncbi:hypothetical protein Tco_0685892 [Tanacetum coccineum]